MGRKERNPDATPRDDAASHDGTSTDSRAQGRTPLGRVGAQPGGNPGAVPGLPGCVDARGRTAAPGCAAASVDVAGLHETEQRRLRQDVVRAVAVQLRAIVATCEFAADCGYSPAITAAVLSAMDDARLLELRDSVAAAVGRDRVGQQCSAVICSSRWKSNGKAAGTDAGGKGAEGSAPVTTKPAGHGRPAGKGE